MTPTTGNTVQGRLQLPTTENPSNFLVFNSQQAVTPSTNGNFQIDVSRTKSTFTYALSETDQRAYIAMTTDNTGSMAINARTTAEALVLLSPLLSTQDNALHAKITNEVKANTSVKALAFILESVYEASTDPLNDPRLMDALTDATLSVLDALQASLPQGKIADEPLPSLPKINLPRFQPFFVPSSPIRVTLMSDMGALTLQNSSGNLLKIEVGNAGPFGIKTNVDWVAQVIELDPDKIQWGLFGDFNFDPNDFDHLIKVGGMQRRFNIEGQVASGVLEGLVDPFGKLAEFIGRLFPDQGLLGV